MLIWIPVDSSDAQSAKITLLSSLVKWALVNFEEGETRWVRFYDTREEAGESWADFIILENKFENYLEFMEEGMMVLVRRQEEMIEEIMEAFKFKELDEAGI